MAQVEKEYKDRLFSFIFGREENKAWTLELYNAVNGSEYTDPNLVEITTIRDVLYLGMHNDISFMIGDDMNLYEQQSTYNPNMPVRQLEYCGYLYEAYMTSHNMNKYGNMRLNLPTPKCVVFYNGTQDEPDEKILKLSDSFQEGEDFDIEVRCRMVNINYGRSPQLFSACKPLKEYSWLIAEIRSKKQEAGIEKAVDQAVSEMPEDFVLKKFLMTHRAEVRGMLLKEYNEAETYRLFKEDGRKEGREEGREEGDARRLVNAVENLKDSMSCSVEKACQLLGWNIKDYYDAKKLIGEVTSMA